jgi:hypothetical protein
MVAVLIGVGKAVLSSTIAITKLSVLFDAHAKADATAFEDVKADLSILKKRRARG